MWPPQFQTNTDFSLVWYKVIFKIWLNVFLIYLAYVWVLKFLQLIIFQNSGNFEKRLQSTDVEDI